MTWWQWPFFLLGLAIALLLAFGVAREIVRAIRQSLRVAYVVHRLDGLRGFSVKVWWSAFKYEITSSYSTIEIGHFKIDRRFNVPIRRAF